VRDHFDVGLVLSLALVGWIAAAGACGNGGGFPDAPNIEPPPDPGTFSLGWAIHSGSGGALTCSDAMAAMVIVNIRNEATGGQDSAQFNCALDNVVSGALFVGTYDLVFSLVGSANNPLATAPAQDGIVISSDHSTPTTAITFVVH
jgi:hypothetical protein